MLGSGTVKFSNYILFEIYNPQAESQNDTWFFTQHLQFTMYFHKMNLTPTTAFEKKHLKEESKDQKDYVTQEQKKAKGNTTSTKWTKTQLLLS